ncbi:hypothetical protein QZH41_008567 [Actinostola sp. cb2023]|nr:hypothetical protein QZH41_008567 [Actinostola sp. cb2023]
MTKTPKSCSHAKSLGYPESKHYVIDPDGPNGAAQPFSVYCNMTSHNGIGVTVVSHSSEARTIVDGCEANGCYRRDVVYDGISSDLQQLRALTSISSKPCMGSIFLSCFLQSSFYIRALSIIIQIIYHGLCHVMGVK